VGRIEGHRVRLRPGQQAGLHVHPGGVAGYVTDGEIAFQLEGGPAQVLRRGTVFFEPPGVNVHRFGKVSASEPAAFIDFYLLTAGQSLIAAVDPRNPTSPCPGPREGLPRISAGKRSKSLLENRSAAGGMYLDLLQA
jgi:hypothetical protein